MNQTRIWTTDSGPRAWCGCRRRPVLHRNICRTSAVLTAAGTTTHHLTMYRAASGALVFGAGTIQWAWGLDTNHDGVVVAVDTRMQQATLNILADMGATATSLSTPGVVAATKSTDTTTPDGSHHGTGCGDDLARCFRDGRRNCHRRRWCRSPVSRSPLTAVRPGIPATGRSCLQLHGRGDRHRVGRNHGQGHRRLGQHTEPSSRCSGDVELSVQHLRRRDPCDSSRQ